MVGAPSGNVVVRTWRSALLVETVPLVTVRRPELDARELVVSSAPDDEAGLSEVDSTLDVPAELDAWPDEVVATVVDVWIAVELSLVVVSEVDGAWLEEVGGNEDEDGSSLLLGISDEEVGTSDEDVGGLLTEDVTSDPEGVAAEPVLLLPSCRLPSMPEAAGSVSDSSKSSVDVLISSGQYSG